MRAWSKCLWGLPCGKSCITSEGESLTTRDYAYGHNGTVTGAIWNSTGGYNSKGAYMFVDNNDYIELSGSEGLNFDEFTLEAWIYPTEFSTYHKIINKAIIKTQSTMFSFKNLSK